jgi:SOS-response transcriptional repressor LexA
MQPMVTYSTDRYSGFSKALNNALDEIQYPAKGLGRQTQLAKDLSKIAEKSITQKAVRKWLEGEGFPRDENIANLCTLTGKPFDYFFDAKLGSKTDLKLTPLMREQKKKYDDIHNRNLTVFLVSDKNLFKSEYPQDKSIVINKFDDDLDGENLFAYKLINDSLTPKYNKDDYLIFSSHKTPCPGEIVIVISQDKDIVLGKYSQITKGEYKVTPLNTDWVAVTSSEENLDFLGVRVQSILN